MDKKRKGWIDPETYSKIVQLIPIPTVDLVVVRSDRCFLLVKRKDYPKKGLYWFPGGKVDFGETPEMAAYRLAEEEIGKKIMAIKWIGSNTLFFRKGWFRKRSQAMGHTFLVRIQDEGQILLDEQSRRYEWVKKIPEYLIHYYPYVSGL